MTDTRARGYVVAMPHDVRGEFTMEYLTKRGKSIDPVKRAQGLRDWIPALSSDVELFRSEQEASNVARVWGGGSIAYDLAAQYEMRSSDGWQRLQPSRAQELGFDL